MKSILVNDPIACTEWARMLLCLDGIIIIFLTTPIHKHMTNRLHTTSLATRTRSSLFLMSCANRTFDVPRPCYPSHASYNPERSSMMDNDRSGVIINSNSFPTI